MIKAINYVSKFNVITPLRDDTDKTVLIIDKYGEEVIIEEQLFNKLFEEKQLLSEEEQLLSEEEPFQTNKITLPDKLSSVFEILYSKSDEEWKKNLDIFLFKENDYKLLKKTIKSFFPNREDFKEQLINAMKNLGLDSNEYIDPIDFVINDLYKK